MILEAEISQGSIVLQDFVLESLHAGFILEVHIALDESLVQFHDLPKSKVLPRHFV